MGIWLPTTEAEIRAGLESGDLPEGHFLDFKRELGGTERARKETAQDIASFALDGGVLIVGVSEDEPGQHALAPILLENLSERAEQIAANRPDPGLSVRTVVIPSEEHTGLGYLVIEIPPSPGAPHMVDGRYWGRSERTKRQLGNAEVLRFHSQRVGYEGVIREALDAEVERQPAGLPDSWMILIAQPLMAADSLGRPYARGELRAVRTLVYETEHQLPDSLQNSYPHPLVASRTQRRARGIAATTLGEGRTATGSIAGDETIDIEVQFSGGIRVLVSSLTYVQEHHRVPEGALRVLEDAPLAWSHRLIAWARALGEEFDYRGPWGFGIRVLGLQGSRASHDPHERQFGLRTLDMTLPVYDAESYEGIATAAYQEMEDGRAAVVDRIVGDLIHALGVADRYKDALP